MCRLFGFKSVLDSQVHSSLVNAENALASQSVNHPDGWGVAYYTENIPHLIRSTDRAVDDHIFHKVSGVVSSKTVIAHIRKASQGDISLLNCHPFQYGHWVFAHNGNLKGFSNYKEDLILQISPKLKPFILGSTDSEILFFLVLSFIASHHPLNDPNPSYEIIKHAIQKTLDVVTGFTGDLYGGQEPKPAESHLTFLLTTGSTLFGFNGGQHLKYSTYKRKCPESSSCPHYNETCEKAATKNTAINHLIFSSEVHDGENIWMDLPLGALVGVDQNMLFQTDLLQAKFIQPS